MIYDIRTTEYARQTLVNLTGVAISVWEEYRGRENEYKYVDSLVEDIINSHGYLPSSYKDFEFIYFHVTTSSNSCKSFYKHGLLDLKQSYLCHDAELRTFLEDNDISINLEEQTLTYRKKVFDITFGNCPIRNTEAHKRWFIGRKFYFDYTICGFLSVCEKNPYGGEVHYRPEVLMDIDNLLGLNLSQKWASTHEPYEIVVKISGEKIIYDGDDNQTEKDKVLNYLTKAYFTAFREPYENVILIKNHVQIPPTDILEIGSMNYWK